MWIIEVYVQRSSASVEIYAARFVSESEADAYQRTMGADGHATSKAYTP